MTTKNRAAGGVQIKDVVETGRRGEIATPPVEMFAPRQLRERFGLSRPVFARLGGFSERAVADWEANEPRKESVRQRIEELRRLLEALQGVMRAESVPGWLTRPNEAFGSLKPLEVIERGEVDRIWRMIFQLESGIPT